MRLAALVSAEYLRKRKQEVERMTLEMFSQEAATRALVREERKEAKEEGRKETREEDIRKVVKMLRTLNYEDGSILENIMKVFDLSEENAREYLGESNSVSSNLDSVADEFSQQLKDLKDVFDN